jgi:molybdopterin-containing oxidoreductase family membrane subunit
MSTTINRKEAQPVPVLWMAILAVLVLAGIVAWVVQLTQGISTTGIGQVIVWGIYIAAFFMLAGVASGCLLLASLGDLNVFSGLAKHRSDLLTASLAAYISAGIVILMDIGHPERVLRFLFSPQINSPFVWDFYVLALAALLSAVYLFVAPKGRWMAWLAGIVAVAVVVVEGLLVSVTGARPLWHSALTPINFVVEAAIVTAGFVILFVQDEKISRWMTSMLRISLLILLGTTLVEVATVAYGGDVEAQAALQVLLSVTFWAGLALGIVLPFILLAFVSQSRAISSLAAVLAFVGVFLAKFNLLIAGQANPLLGGPAAYVPTLVEFGGVIGVVALAVLLFALGRSRLPAKA